MNESRKVQDWIVCLLYMNQERSYLKQSSSLSIVADSQLVSNCRIQSGGLGLARAAYRRKLPNPVEQSLTGWAQLVLRSLGSNSYLSIANPTGKDWEIAVTSCKRCLFTSIEWV